MSAAPRPGAAVGTPDASGAGGADAGKSRASGTAGAEAGRPGAVTPRPLEVRRLGRVPYADGLSLQDELVALRRTGQVPDTLLLLEHPHVITLGSSARMEHVLADARELERLGVERFEVGRGGDVTYHGPGQLVAYPILDLKPDRKDLHAYLRALEEVLIRVADAFGVRAERRPGATGIWTPRGKLAAIGVRVSSGWITSHGVALNVRTDLSYFATIVPCGIPDADVTSLARELGRDVEMRPVEDEMVRQVSAVFGARATGLQAEGTLSDASARAGRPRIAP